ncbi:MAG: imidazole glycerol phosphate synthase subunit HisH [Pseudomonadota bacterium]
MSLAIIDSGGANIGSVRFALQRLGADSVFTADPDVIRRADRVILPGVGAAGAAMAQLEGHDLVDCIRGLTQPVLGICLGMQLLFEASTEGDVGCLGIIPGTLERFPEHDGLRVPHMGWNHTTPTREDPLTSGLGAEPWFYFVHSYYAPVSDATLAHCRHGIEFSAVVQRRNFRGAQFHPERSATHGAKVLENFLALS